MHFCKKSGEDTSELTLALPNALTRFENNPEACQLCNTGLATVRALLLQPVVKVLPSIISSIVCTCYRVLFILIVRLFVCPILALCIELSASVLVRTRVQLDGRRVLAGLSERRTRGVAARVRCAEQIAHI